MGIHYFFLFTKYKEEIQVITTVNEFLRDVQTVAINIMQITMKLEANEQTYNSNLWMSYLF